jgi:hypothetical protein
VCDYKPITNELDLFLLFYELDRLGYLLRSRLDKGIIPDISVKHVQAVLKELGKKRDWAFTQLPQFGVEPFKTTGETITEEYRAWYKWWKDYFSELPEEMKLKIFEGTYIHSDILVPSGTWKDLIGFQSTHP